MRLGRRSSLFLDFLSRLSPIPAAVEMLFDDLKRKHTSCECAEKIDELFDEAVERGFSLCRSEAGIFVAPGGMRAIREACERFIVHDFKKVERDRSRRLRRWQEVHCD